MPVPFFYFKFTPSCKTNCYFQSCPLKQENTEQKMKYSESNLSYKDGTCSSPRKEGASQEFQMRPKVRGHIDKTLALTSPQTLNT